MVEVTRKKYPLNPTLRWTNSEGRLTAEAFRFIRAVGELIETITIVDGEVTTEMLADLAVQASKLDDGAVVIGKLAAGSIYVSTLFVDEVVITGKIAQNAVSELAAAAQVGSVGPSGNDVVSVAIPTPATTNSGVLINFTATMSLPVAGAGNFGNWYLILMRNGVEINRTPALYYDDNFAYPLSAAFIDYTPGVYPTYTIQTGLYSGPGLFTVAGGVINCSLFKR